MKDTPFKLSESQVTSEIFTISPTQIDFIAKMFADSVADGMNMRAFAPKFKDCAKAAIVESLKAARRMGAVAVNKDTSVPGEALDL